jgi:hypothetical protein
MLEVGHVRLVTIDLVISSLERVAHGLFVAGTTRTFGNGISGGCLKSSWHIGGAGSDNMSSTNIMRATPTDRLNLPINPRSRTG